MKQFFKTLGLLFLGVFLIVSIAQARYKWDHYKINVYRDTGYTSGPYSADQILTGIQYSVFSISADGTEGNNAFRTLYNDRRGLSSKANPTTADTFDHIGRIEFYLEDMTTAGTGTSTDILVVDNAGGFSAYMTDVTPSVHSIIIDERPGIEHKGTIWFCLNTNFIWSGISTAAAAPLSEAFAHTGAGPFDTGIDLIAGTMIRDVTIEYIVPARRSANCDISIGYGSASEAFRSGLTGNSETDDTGTILPIYLWDTSTFGDSLYTMSSCLEVGAGWGSPMADVFIMEEAGSLNYSLTSGDERAAITDYGWGFIHVFFTPMRP